MDIGQTTPALEWALSQCWAIRPEALEAGLRIAARAHGGVEALQARAGQPLENTRTVIYREDGPRRVAVVPVTGPIFRRANLFTEISGGTSTDILARDIQAAADDPSIHAIVLEIDSPGGQVPGTAELAALVRQAACRKPVVAHADGMMCSAAYWIGSAATRVITSPTGDLGCIGVVTRARKREDPDRAPYIEFVSSNAENKRLDPASDAGRAAIQREIDDIEAVFVEAVASYRGVTPETVRSRFGRGGTFIGCRAVQAGLADAVGDFESIVSDLSAGRLPGPGAAAPRERGRGVTMTTRERLVYWLMGADNPDPEPQPTPQPEPTPTPQPEPAPQPNPAPTPHPQGQVQVQGQPTALATAPDPEADRLRAELDRLRREAIERAANDFAARLVAEGRIPAGERYRAATEHARAAIEDAGLVAHVELLPDQQKIVVRPGRDTAQNQAQLQSRTAAVEAAYAARPRSMMTDELIATPLDPVRPMPGRDALAEAHAQADADVQAAREWAEATYAHAHARRAR